MTDLVKIATKYRNELVAEVAKLDEFLRMAEKLTKFAEVGADKASDAGYTLLTDRVDSAKLSPPPAAQAGNGAEAKA